MRALANRGARAFGWALDRRRPPGPTFWPVAPCTLGPPRPARPPQPRIAAGPVLRRLSRRRACVWTRHGPGAPGRWTAALAARADVRVTLSEEGRRTLGLPSVVIPHGVDVDASGRPRTAPSLGVPRARRCARHRGGGPHSPRQGPGGRSAGTGPDAAGGARLAGRPGGGGARRRRGLARLAVEARPGPGAGRRPTARRPPLLPGRHAGGAALPRRVLFPGAGRGHGVRLLRGGRPSAALRHASGGRTDGLHLPARGRGGAGGRVRPLLREPERAARWAGRPRRPPACASRCSARWTHLGPCTKEGRPSARAAPSQ